MGWIPRQWLTTPAQGRLRRERSALEGTDLEGCNHLRPLVQPGAVSGGGGRTDGDAEMRAKNKCAVLANEHTSRISVPPSP